MTGRTYNTTNTIEQTLKLYPTLYAVVGMRLHAGILSCVHGIPLIMISYGAKTEELVNLIDNVSYTITPEKVTLATFTELWKSLEDTYDYRKSTMLERYKIIRADLVTKLRNL